MGSRVGFSHKGQEEQESNAHITQTINNLSVMKIDYGMLINFGSPKFESRKLVTPSSPNSCDSCTLWPPPTPSHNPPLLRLLYFVANPHITHALHSCLSCSLWQSSTPSHSCFSCTLWLKTSIIHINERK